MNADYVAAIDPRKFIGTRIGNYIIRDVLGKGAYGIVFLGKHVTITDRWIALKYIQPAHQRQASQELDALGLLEHNHIVKLWDVEDPDHVAGLTNVEQNDQKHFFLMLDYIAGGNLQQALARLDGKLLDFASILRFMEHVCSALEYMHTKRILHFDLKPGNILLKPPAEYGQSLAFVVADFGIATLLRQSNIVTNVGGTPAYMAPEIGQMMANSRQVGSLGEPDYRADLYSLAVILYELVTGRLPFWADSKAEMALMHQERQPDLPSTVRNDVPKTLDAVLLKALAKQPDARFQSAAEFLSVVEKSLQPVLLTASANRVSAQEFSDEIAQLARLGNPESYEIRVESALHHEEARSFFSTAKQLTIGSASTSDLKLNDAEHIKGNHLLLEVIDEGLQVTKLVDNSDDRLDQEPLLLNKPHRWLQDQWLYLGKTTYSLKLPKAPAPIIRKIRSTEGVTEIVSFFRKQGVQPQFEVWIEPGIVQVGQDTKLKVFVRPENVEPMQYRAHVVAGQGLDPKMFDHGQARRIRSNESIPLEIGIDSHNSANVRAGLYTLAVEVRPESPEVLPALITVPVRVSRRDDFTISLDTRELNVRSRKPSIVHLSITNRGNDMVDFSINNTRHDNLKITSGVPSIRIDGGKTKTIPVSIKPLKRTSTDTRIFINVSAASDEKQVPLTFSYSPLRMSLLTKVFLLLLVVALGTLVIYFLIPEAHFKAVEVLNELLRLVGSTTQIPR